MKQRGQNKVVLREVSQTLQRNSVVLFFGQVVKNNLLLSEMYHNLNVEPHPQIKRRFHHMFINLITQSFEFNVMPKELWIWIFGTNSTQTPKKRVFSPDKKVR